jgi:hypothetical protein
MGVERREGREVEGVKDRTAEERPAVVPARAIQAGEIRARWAWVEPTVWTERMLAALEQGVKGGKWPNAYFARHGLFSLATAHAEACQSSRR